MQFRKAGAGLVLAVWAAAAQDPLILPVGPAGTDPMRFELRDSGAMRMPDGILYQGDASLVTPMGRMVLAQSELWFGYAPGTQQVQTVRGKAFVPTPLSEEEVSIDEPVMAEVGYDLGENLQDLGVPLYGKRGYLFFRFDAGLTMRVGKAPPEDLEEEEDTSFTLSFPAGATARMVVDPLDPMFYFAGGIATPNKDTKGETGEGTEPVDDGITAGIGNSRQGLFPFRPLHTWGIEDKAREFQGHRIVTGSFPLFALPVMVRGHLITNLDPLATGELAIDPFGLGVGPVVQAGANGRFAFSLDFLKVSGLGNLANLTIPLGKATAAVEIVNDRQVAYLSGTVDPEAELGMGLLLAHDGELQAAALASTSVDESRLLMDGVYKLGASEFGKLTGFDVGNVLRAEGRLRVDRAGFFLHGLTEAGVNAGPLSSQGRITLEMEIPAEHPDNRYFQLAGRFRFAGLGTDGLGRVTRNGVAVAGKLTAPDFDMSVNGGVVQQNGATVYGNMSVPAVLQPDLNAEIKAAAAVAQQEIDRRLSELERATKDFEFELSLRGMRTVVPPVTDAIIAEINRQIPANINARWPRINTLFGSIEAPGKSAAINLGNERAEPYRVRLRNLKRQMQTGDSAQARAALEAALRDVVANPRLRVTYTVPVVNATITIIDYQIVSASLQQQLNVALQGVRALPEVSSVKVKAEQAWNLVPKKEILRSTAEAIEKNATAAIPRIETIGFRFPLGRAEWEYQVVLTHQGKRSTVPVRLAPDNIGSIGKAIGQAFAQIL